jgi:hypothetical protein
LTRTCPRNAIVILSSLARPALAGHWLVIGHRSCNPEQPRPVAGPREALVLRPLG